MSWDDEDGGLEPHEQPDYADMMADRADDELHRMKEDGTYWAWVKAGRPPAGEWHRRVLEDEAAAAGLDLD